MSTKLRKNRRGRRTASRRLPGKDFSVHIMTSPQGRLDPIHRGSHFSVVAMRSSSGWAYHNLCVSSNWFGFSVSSATMLIFAVSLQDHFQTAGRKLMGSLLTFYTPQSNCQRSVLRTTRIHAFKLRQL